MSLFGGGRAQSAAQMSAEKMEAAVTEIEMVADIFNRIVSSCHGKCIGTRYNDSQLNKAEGVCIDRCVAKFFAVNEAVGKRMQQAQGQQQAAGSSTTNMFGF
ncbi:uncharacterized protein L969DRAFT_96786 [Mixia osmundae IAM 14324]|uniref:Mitochondrial import inner membrane translocase subunit n=1 Tax=Mixia osmundae (strain CBS 9802 / IAM 14324 / JCM 22182 / KY 12970) TaxID=764103 RepID=G7DS12_MIXOS|nr:uncharacterized protein L969DRAFT_96786 [Mixia osmundae IAM 14324]KEI37231.1 hypothetical protein L969DRAFT_96786 [Mixia osmundae IAM 14324]GAA93372.1 hypothetical protein E5Q_00012 [Mixia osmundae IAM 14324]